MKFSVVATVLALSTVGTMGGSTYCSVEQATDLGNAMQVAFSTINPANYQTPEAYVDAVLDSIKAQLDVGDVPSTYPCYACVQTALTSIFNCSTNNCSESDITKIFTDLQTCATSTINDKSAMSLGTLAVAAGVLLTLL